MQQRRESTIAIYPGRLQREGSRVPHERVRSKLRGPHPSKIAKSRTIVIDGPFGGEVVTMELLPGTLPKGDIPYELSSSGVNGRTPPLKTPVKFSMMGATRTTIHLTRNVSRHTSGGTFFLSIQVGDNEPLELEFLLVSRNYEGRLKQSQKQAMASHLVYHHDKNVFQRVPTDIIHGYGYTVPIDSLLVSQSEKERPPHDDGSKGWVMRITRNPTGLSLPPLKRQALEITSHTPITLAPLKNLV